MNRRKAIKRLFITGLGGAIAFSGYKWYDWHKAPDLHYLSQQSDLISALAETIIPTTDSPGASECGVGEYIIIMVKDCSDTVSQNRFIDGLKELQGACKLYYGKPYLQCTEDEKHAILTQFEKKGRPYKGIIGKAQVKYLGKSFFSLLKEYTVTGYCTSKQGSTKGLAYLPVPGSYHGCIPLQPGQKAWALN